MITFQRLLTILWLVAVGGPVLLAANEAQNPPPSLALRTLHVEPARVELRGANRQQQLLVTGETAAGRMIDVTEWAEIKSADRAVASTVGGLIAGVRDGQTRLTVRFMGQTVEVPVTVTGFENYPPVHFANDIVPLFSKLGCNSGGCHGKASGQNGFKLSVFGFDPAADYRALVTEARGRRVFPACPERSLVLRKASAEVPHGGGRRIEPGSRDHELLLEWLKQGMRVGQTGAPQLIGLKVSPPARTVEFGRRQQILATAEYSDGSLRDVTAAAAYMSNAPLVAESSPTGQVSVGQSPGEAAITVNYMGQVAAVRILVPRANTIQPYPSLVAHNRIDEFVGAKLRDMGIVPSELAPDATFLRRVYLDTLGTLPTITEAREFLADASVSKREALIQRLLVREEYADYGALKWADILLVDRKTLGERGAFELHRWLKQQVAANRPYDAWVRELLTASGNSGQHGPVNFYRALRTPEELTRAVSQAFLGIRLECAQCHHHPFERWSQDDFYGLAGFFNGLERKPLEASRELVYHAGWREMKVPVFNRVVPAHVLDGPPLDLTSGDPRERLAQWLTKSNNPWFARLLANRLWKQFFGRGIVEPEDDLRSTNPGTNEPLLNYLTEQVTESGFDVRAVTRQILASRTYQTSSIPNPTNRDDEQNFSRYYVKRLPAEVLLDAISAATGTSESFDGFPPGTRAIELWDNRLPSYFLEIFGRPARTSPCECGRTSDPTMSQALHLMNAPEVGHKVSHPAGRVANLIHRGASQAEILDELCLAALARQPKDNERHVAAELFGENAPRHAAEDLLWALLNSYDFLFIH